MHVSSYLLCTAGPSIPSSEAWAVVLVYQALFLATLLLGRRMCPGIYERVSGSVRLMMEGTSMPLLLGLASLGVALHVYAKLSPVQPGMQGGIHDFKLLWAVSREGLPFHVRTASVMGQLLSAFIYPALLMSGYRLTERTVKKSDCLYYVAILGLGMVYAVFQVSRMVMISFVFILLLGNFLRHVVDGYSSFRWKLSSLGAVILPMVMIVGLATAWIFFDNARREWKDNQHVAPTTYSNYYTGYFDELPIRDRVGILIALDRSQESFLDNATIDRWMLPLRRWIGLSCPMGNMVLLYLNHGIYNLEKIASGNVRGDSILASVPRFYGTRLGLVDRNPPSRVRVYGLGGATLMGSAWHDAGWVGILLLALLLGGAASSIPWLLGRGGPAAVLGLGMYVGVGLTSAFSFMFVAPGVISFPFAILGILLAFSFPSIRGLIAKAWRRTKGSPLP